MSATSAIISTTEKVCKSPQRIKNIEDCGEGFIYVGRWLNGKKYGNGRLYNKSGLLIYDGRFDNDKPCGQLLPILIRCEVFRLLNSSMMAKARYM